MISITRDILRRYSPSWGKSERLLTDKKIQKNCVKKHCGSKKISAVFYFAKNYDRDNYPLLKEARGLNFDGDIFNS